MNLITIIEKFPDQAACIAHLEKIRWGDEAHCPHCGGFRVARKKENNRVGRWNCHDCRNSFNVLQGTVFQQTKIQLQKWFLAIALMVNAKKSLSSCQLARDMDATQASCWYMQQRIRVAMANEERSFLAGIVEIDETCPGGNPRRNKRDDDNPPRRGRGTKKTPITGAVERGGRVAAQVATDITGKGILHFIKSTIDTKETILVTDEFSAYNAVDAVMARVSINHSKQYVDGDVHTNTIEGFWSHLKRALIGQHHHYSKAYTPLYVAEACWKYNRRDRTDGFSSFLATSMGKMCA